VNKDEYRYRKHLKTHLYQSAVNSPYSDLSGAPLIDSFYWMIMSLGLVKFLLTY